MQWEASLEVRTSAVLHPLASTLIASCDHSQSLHAHTHPPDPDPPPPLWHTTFRHVLVSAGADRWLRWWDVHEGRLLAVQFTGHAAGENLPGLAVSPDNSTLVTGDTAGYVMVRGGGVVVR